MTLAMLRKTGILRVWKGRRGRTFGQIIDPDQRSKPAPGACPHSMNDTKPRKPAPAAHTNSDERQNQFRRMIEEYAAELREIIRKLRKKLN